MVHVLQRVTVSSPAGSTVAKTDSKSGQVPLTRHDALKAHVHGYTKLIAVAGKYRFQLRLFSSEPGDEIRDLLSLAVLGRSHEHRFWSLTFDPSAVEALEPICDLVLPPADLHRGASVSPKCPEADLALLPLE